MRVKWKGVAVLVIGGAEAGLRAWVEQGAGTAWAVPTLRVLAWLLKRLQGGE